MPVRQIVEIDENKCDGCGQCVPNCEEGAIRIVDGKARLISDVYCDGLGACLGHCPQGAISLIEREAEGFDEAAVASRARVAREASATLPVLGQSGSLGGGCPGSQARRLQTVNSTHRSAAHATVADRIGSGETQPSGLANWPVQLRLVPPQAPYLQQANLLLVADCVPFALADFHRRFLDGRPVLIGCPKLDDGHFYVQKLAQILLASRICSITIVHMEVPCCLGLVHVARAAIELADVDCPLRETTISVDGQVVESNPRTLS